MKETFDLPRKWHFAQKSAAKSPAALADKNLFQRAYFQMLESGQAHSKYFLLHQHGENWFWQLGFLDDWCDAIAAGAKTNFSACASYNVIKPEESASHIRWNKDAAGQNLHPAAHFNLGHLLGIMENQLKDQPVALPAPKTVQTLWCAVTAAQAIRPYLEVDGLKNLEQPDHIERLHEIFDDIIDMIGFLGRCSGLSPQMIQDMQQEIITPTITTQPRASSGMSQKQILWNWLAVQPNLPEPKKNKIQIFLERRVLMKKGE